MWADYERSRALPGSIKRSKGGPPYIYNGSERGNERYHAHGPLSGRERPPRWGDMRRVGGVARAGGPGVAVAPADMLPLLDAAPAQRRSGGPLHVLLRERHAAQPGA